MVCATHVCRSNRVGSATTSVLDLMKNKLLHLTNETQAIKEKEQLLANKTNIDVSKKPYPKNSIASIYLQPRNLKTEGLNDKKSPGSSIFRRKHEITSSYTEEGYEGIKWKPDLSSSNTSKTTLQAKSEFDSLIKDWISTNWLNASPIIQQKPCHILIHDKLLFDNLSLFDIVYNLILSYVPELKNNILYEKTKISWNNQMDNLLQKRKDNMTNLQIERSFREIIKDIYLPFVKNQDDANLKLQSFVKDSFLIRKIINVLYKNVKYDKKIFDKVKNIENLNERNDITIVKDNELTFIPSLDYINLLKKVNNNVNASLKKLHVLKYKSIFGNKVNDYQNLQTLKHVLTTKKSHCNEKFIIITEERTTSLEYFRLLKLFNKSYSNLKLKGCVIYLNRSQAKKNTEMIGQTEYTGKEMYYVVEDFSAIYDIIEVL